MATHSSIPAWRLSIDRGAYTVQRVTKSQMCLSAHARSIVVFYIPFTFGFLLILFI